MELQSGDNSQDRGAPAEHPSTVKAGEPGSSLRAPCAGEAATRQGLQAPLAHAGHPIGRGHRGLTATELPRAPQLPNSWGRMAGMQSKDWKSAMIRDRCTTHAVP